MVLHLEHWIFCHWYNTHTLYLHYGTVGYFRTCCDQGGGSPIHKKYFQCRGTEQELSQCDTYNITLQPHRENVPTLHCNGTYIKLMHIFDHNHLQYGIYVCINTLASSESQVVRLAMC